MNWLAGVFTYVIIWWTTLFAVLPWGNEPSHAPNAGDMPGAPANPRLCRKFVITSGIAAIIWLMVFAFVQSNLISFRTMVRDLPD